MRKDTPHALPEQRRLVQRVITGSIPSAGEFDQCRDVLKSKPDAKVAFAALFTLLEGAVADPFFPIGDSENVVTILKGLARGLVRAEDLL